MNYLEEFDKLKTKVLKYILFKKRTESEIRQKFISDEGEMLNDVIDELVTVFILIVFEELINTFSLQSGCVFP